MNKRVVSFVILICAVFSVLLFTTCYIMYHKWNDVIMRNNLADSKDIPIPFSVIKSHDVCHYYPLDIAINYMYFLRSNHKTVVTRLRPTPSGMNLAIIDVYINTESDSSMPIPELRKYKMLSESIIWAPAIWQDGLDKVYCYSLRIIKSDHSPSWPTMLIVHFKNEPKTFFITTYKDPFALMGQSEQCATYSNYWTHQRHNFEPNGRPVNIISSIKKWQWLGIIQTTDKRIKSVEGMGFRPIPTIAYFEPAMNGKPTAIIAGWRPSVFKGNNVHLTVQYYDGSKQRFILKKGKYVKGFDLVWKFPT